jgi:outer membrane immunogenic protein
MGDDSKNKLRTQLLTTTAAMVLSGAAYAADMAVKAPIAPPIPYATWQGGYIGGNIGVARLNGDCTQIFTTGYQHGACSSYYGSASQQVAASGLTAGVQAGYDWQNRSFVYGVVADWSGTGLSRTVTVFDTLSSLPFFKAKVDWLASFRTRMGLAVDDTLVYITGGLAVADIKSAAGQLGDCPTYCFDNQVSKVRGGWVAGVGVEHKFTPNLSVFSEFLYYDFGRVSATSLTPDGSYTYTTQFQHEIFHSRMGVNWRF